MTAVWRRAGGLAGVAIAVAVTMALRVAQLLVIWWTDHAALPDALLGWDAGWFVTIATDGYPDGYTYDQRGNRLGNGFAFFPLFPLLIKTMTLSGVPAEWSSISVAACAGLVAGPGIYLLGVALWTRATGYALMILVCAQPMSVVLLMAYTEPLFLTLVAAGLLAAWRRLWWAAGLAGVAAALTRPTGMALAVAITIAAALAWRDSTPAQRIWAALAAGASLLATPLFLAWVGWRVGEWDAWFKVQSAGWGSTFDFGQSVWTFLTGALRSGTGMVDTVTAWLILLTLVFTAVAAFQRIWPPLLGFGLLALGLALGQAGYWHSKPRLLVPVLLLACVPLARALTRVPRTTAVGVLALWSAFGLWFGAHMITLWPYTI